MDGRLIAGDLRPLVYNKKNMQFMESEELFKYYLEKNKIEFERDYAVNSHNVDFRLVRKSEEILCDVKEIRDSNINSRLNVQRKRMGGSIDAQEHIRGDIRKLRKKINSAPKVPVILVSMNFSSNYFTALTVSRALMGEVGMIFNRENNVEISDIHHLHKGNASLTTGKTK